MVTQPGAGEPVPYSLVADLQISAAPTTAAPAIRVTGTLMESSRVFNRVLVHVEGSLLFLTVTSSFLEYLPDGGPDFDVVVPAPLTPGTTYGLLYHWRGEPDHPLGQLQY